MSLQKATAGLLPPSDSDEDDSSEEESESEEEQPVRKPKLAVPEEPPRR